MNPVSGASGRPGVPGGRRGMAAVLAVVIAGVAAVAVVLGWRHSPAGCPAAGSPLGRFAGESQMPRLCALGAPSRLIGSGRVAGASWREVVTPPLPWGAYRAAGFGLAAGMSGREGSCIVEAVSNPRGYVSDGCGQWEPAGPGRPGQLLGVGCDRQVIVVCYASLGQHADHFLLRMQNGSGLRLASVSFHGRSYTAFALRLTQAARSLAAYDSSGRLLAAGTSFGTG